MPRTRSIIGQRAFDTRLRTGKIANARGRHAFGIALALRRRIHRVLAIVQGCIFAVVRIKLFASTTQQGQQ